MIIIIMVMNPEHHHLLFCQFTRTRCYLKILLLLTKK